MLKYLLLAGAVTAGTAVLPSESKASEWGCQVLLCLSGDWKGTPSCHPPIKKLIAAMAKPGFDWPTCPQANSSAARRDPYKECPSGFSSTGDEIRHGGREGTQIPMCVRRVTNNTWGGGVKKPFGGKKPEATPINLTNGMITMPDGTKVRVDKRTESSGGERDHSSTTIYSFPRPLREKQWYIEYDDVNKIRQRAWFDLNL